MASLAGKKVGGFELLEQIGKGGMAEVYRAYQRSLRREVAVKILPVWLAQEAGFVERFEREAQAVAKLDHPNILTVFDYGEQEGITYLAMPLASGGSLREKLQAARALSPQQADFYCQQMAGALSYAHDHGIIHRDVKPANMLLTSDDRLLLADFGIAKVLAGSTSLTQANTIMGTPEYMAPEQFQNQPVDNRADIYALGIVLFQMLTGRVPFTGDTPVAVIFQQVNAPLPALRQFNPILSPAMEQVLIRALAKNPAARYATARELAADFHTAVLAAQSTIPLTPLPPPAAAPVICQNCGSDNLSLSTYCRRCGVGLGADAAVTQSAPWIQNPVPPVPLPPQPPPLRGAPSSIPSGTTKWLWLGGAAVGLVILLLGGLAFGVISAQDRQHAEATATAETQATAGAVAQRTATAVAIAQQATATAAAQATASAAAQATATATDRATSFANVRKAGSLIFQDTLSNQDNNNWFVGESATGSYEFRNGTYVITSRGANGPGSFLGNKTITETNYAVEIEAAVVTGKDTQLYLNVHRSSDEKNYYAFYIFPESQKYNLLLVTEKQPKGMSLTGLTPSGALHTSGVNRMAVEVKGSQILLFINDHLVSVITDSTLTQGHAEFGLYGTTASAAFSHVAVYRV